MTLLNKDRVKETAPAPGTSPFALAGAVTGFRTFNSAIGNGNTVYYAAWDGAGAWEIGIGTYSSGGNTLARTTVLQSSTGSPINFSNGVTVWCNAPAAKLCLLDASGNLILPAGLTVTGGFSGPAGGTFGDRVTVSTPDAPNAMAISYGSASYHMGALGEDTTNNVAWWANTYGGANPILSFRIAGITNANETAWVDGSGLHNTSARATKENFESTDYRAVLEKLAAMDVPTWNFKKDKGKKHIGAIAEDFHAAFGLNGKTKTAIGTVDADGVALAAIKGLYEIVKEQAAKIAALEAAKG